MEDRSAAEAQDALSTRAVMQQQADLKSYKFQSSDK